MGTRVTIVAVLGSLALLVLVFELVRRRRLMERYALLWFISASVLLLLSAWQDLLSAVAKGMGIFYPPSALFVIAFGFVLLMLLHFSLVISRLSDQNKVLAQQLAMLRQALDEQSETLARVESRSRSEREANLETDTRPTVSDTLEPSARH